MNVLSSITAENMMTTFYGLMGFILDGQCLFCNLQIIQGTNTIDLLILSKVRI